MKFFSTRNKANEVTSAQAILKGLSEEGGLFVPAEFPKVDYEKICTLPYTELAPYILKSFLTDYDEEFLNDAVNKTYGDAFQGKAGETVKVKEGMYSLELWHGPTCAFKDYALQLMPKLLVEAKKMLNRTEITKILVATSGDTGKAALDGYHDLEGIEIAVFYPNSGTSEIQRLQMATQEGSNVSVWAVNGNFDDAQTGVKKVFNDKELARQLDEKNIRLSSANSINWGRLVPQVVYYFAAYGKMVTDGTIRMGDIVNFCVPTGNFGDILAGYYAKQMGLPVGKLICASNKNNVLTDFFKTGKYDARRKFYKTSSPSMDILISSNLERLMYHITGSDAKVSGYMKELSANGMYQISNSELAELQKNFACGCCTDEQGAEIIRKYFDLENYLCDTHTAVAFKVAEDYQASTGDVTPVVIVSTASPFKFPCAVIEALGKEAPTDDFSAMIQLESSTGVKAPDSLSGLKNKEERFKMIIDAAQIADVALGNLHQ